MLRSLPIIFPIVYPSYYVANLLFHHCSLTTESLVYILHIVVFRLGMLYKKVFVSKKVFV